MPSIKTWVIANPRAGAYRVGNLWPRIYRRLITELGPIEVHFTKQPGDATHFTNQGIFQEGVTRIIGIGGDGTLNECINGFLDKDQTIPSHVAFIPLSVGTGSDFARNFALNTDISRYVVDIRRFQERMIDVGCVTYTCPNQNEATKKRLFLNIASVGSSGTIVYEVNRTNKLFGGRLSFFLGTYKALTKFKEQTIVIDSNNYPQEQAPYNAVIVANGSYFGGGMQIAPQARWDDGLFDVVTIQPITPLTFLRRIAALYRGDIQSIPEIKVWRTNQLTLRHVHATNTPYLLETDGEQPGHLPVTFTILPAALRLCAPPKKGKTSQDEELFRQTTDKSA